MTYDYSKSKFSAADLKGKKVQVRILLDQGEIYEGEATFDAIQDHRGYIRVAIIYNWFEPSEQAVYAARVNVSAEALPNIVKNPEGSKTEFSLNAV